MQPSGDSSYPDDPSRRAGTLLAAASIALAALLVYWQQLGFYFTDVDTFSLIATARIHSFEEFVNVLRSPLMQGEMENALFYRPFTSLTWGIDERIWGLDPFGYHLTDLCIHVANGVILYFVLAKAAVLRATSAPDATRGRVEAWLAALLFAIHPLTMETVPAIARRPDLLFCLFQLLTLTSLLRHLRRPRGRDLVGAAVFCALGLASKDSAVVIPAVAGLFVLCFSAESTFVGRFVDGVRRCWPLAIVSGLFLLQRTAVLGGMGGYVNAAVTPLPSVIKSSFATYMCVIVLPGNLDACQMRVFPLVGAAVVVMLACVVWLFRDPTESATRRVWFAVLALTGYFLLYTASRTVALTRTMYSLVPFLCIPLAWGVIEGVGWLRERWLRGDPDAAIAASPRTGPLDRVVRGAFVGVCALLVASIVGGAWRGQYLDEWRANGRVAERALRSAAEALDPVPKGSVVYLVDFPYQVSPGRPVMRQRPILMGFSVQGWANLAFPGKELAVIGLSYLTIDGVDPRDHDAHIRFDPERALLDITLGPGASAASHSKDRVYGKGSPLDRATYHRKPDGLVIELKPQVPLGADAAFLVYVGDRVVLRDSGAWTASHSASRTGETDEANPTDDAGEAEPAF